MTELLRKNKLNSPSQVEALFKTFFDSTLAKAKELVKRRYSNKGVEWQDGSGAWTATESDTHLQRLSTVGATIISPDQLGIGGAGEHNARLVRISVIGLEGETDGPFTIAIRAAAPSVIIDDAGREHNFVFGADRGLHLSNIAVDLGEDGRLHHRDISNAKGVAADELRDLFGTIGPFAVLPPLMSAIRIEVRLSKGQKLPKIKQLKLKIEYVCHY